MATSKLVKANEKIAEHVVGGYKKIETGVVGGYKAIEGSILDDFNRMVDEFVERFLAQDGETVAEAKMRLTAEEEARRAKANVGAQR